MVLRYDRSRGVRATRGAEDWGDWLQGALGKESSSLTLTREPGSALELIDRYLLRTLNLHGAARTAATAPRRIAVIIEFAEFVVPRGDAAHLGGPFAANTVKVLGWANDPAIVQSNIVTVLLSEGLHDLSELVVENPHAAALHLPLPDEAEMVGLRPDAGGGAVSGPRRAIRRAARDGRRATDRAEPGRRADGDRAGARQRPPHHVGVARSDQEGSDRARRPGAARLHRVAVHARPRRRARRGQGVAARGCRAAQDGARCARCRWAI